MENNFHKEIEGELKKHAGHGTTHSDNPNYHGSSHFSYHTSNPVKRKIAKEFLRKHKNLSQKEFVDLLNALYKARSHDEKHVAGMLLGYAKPYRKNILPKATNEWLTHLEGWAEIDSLCQSNFTADEMLSSWKEWKQLLVSFSKSKNISKRRASLVLLTGLVTKSDDAKLTRLAFQNIEQLKNEENILITKAISWLLRSLTVKHKKEVTVYLRQNEVSLPRVAVWETKRKLLTGRK